MLAIASITEHIISIINVLAKCGWQAKHSSASMTLV